MRILLILFLLFTSSVFEQEIYIRKKDEDIESFITRCFPETKDNIDHKIIEGRWGDTSYAKKVVVFYRAGNNGAEAIVLQLISNNKYQRLKIDHSFGIGAYPNTSTIMSVFFYDTNDDGLKELIVIETGIIRGFAEIIEYNEETKQNDTIPLSPSIDCCGYSVFGQNANSETIEMLDQEENYEWRQCDAASIRLILEGKKKK